MNNKRFWMVLVLILCLAALVAPVSAADLAVANGAVEITDNGICSLKEAIQNANDTSTGLVHDDCATGDPAGADTITLPANGNFTLTAALPFTDNGLSTIFSEITVEGNGSTIERDQFVASKFRFFTVAIAGDLTLNDLTLTGGDVDNPAGAIYNGGGSLTLNRCTLTDNDSESGGAILNNGTAVIRDSTLDSNTAMWDVAGPGGAIANYGELTIEGSAIYANFSSHTGGGIYNSSQATLFMTNSSLFSNQTGGTGGGLYNIGEATLTNTTVRINSAGGSGGIYNAWMITLARSLITYNFVSGSPNNMNNVGGGTVVADDYNLFGHSGAAAVTGFTPGVTDFTPAEAIGDIMQGTAALNGGPTLNFALVADSPAIDAAPSADCGTAPVDVDQRGLPRGVDGDGGASSDECDVGAYEAQGVPADPKLYVSTAKAGVVAGIPAAVSDILVQDLGSNSWAMHFDGSDVGVSKAVSSFAHLSDGSLLLVFKANQAISGVGTFTPWDVAHFIPSSLGADTAGTFEWYIDGSDVFLTTAAEKIDALDVLSDGRVLISTAGTLSVPAGGVLKSQDEDLTALTPTMLGATTAGTWAIYFNGTTVPGLKGEDVSGAHVDEATGDLYLSILAAFNVGGVPGNGKDVLQLTPSGAPGGYDVTSFWRGAEEGFNLNLGGIEMD